MVSHPSGGSINKDLINGLRTRSFSWSSPFPSPIQLWCTTDCWNCLFTIKGDTGEKGDKGPVGQGIDGPDGDQGLQGKAVQIINFINLDYSRDLRGTALCIVGSSF